MSIKKAIFCNLRIHEAFFSKIKTTKKKKINQFGNAVLKRSVEQNRPSKSHWEARKTAECGKCFQLKHKALSLDCQYLCQNLVGWCASGRGQRQADHTDLGVEASLLSQSSQKGKRQI